MINITIIGTGYVGLVTGCALADFGHNVICVDTDDKKIEPLKQGVIPIYEEGLQPLLMRNVAAGRLHFSTDTAEAVRTGEVIFIAVGTPSNEDGSADLQHVLTAAREIARAMDRYTIIVDKSTVPIGTARKVRDEINNELTRLGKTCDFDIVSNPEFLREGSAVHDFFHPDRVILGADNGRAFSVMKEIYQVLYVNEAPFIETSLETAEMIKYATNTFLAVKITFINEMANVCDAVGADVKKVARAMGLDGRISPKFLHAGPGYGGSCFPKDVRALYYISHMCGAESKLLAATLEANEKQKQRMVEKIASKIDIKNTIIGILGITFKPNTDDCREAPSLTIIKELVARGARLRLYDPHGRTQGERLLNKIADSIIWCDDMYDALVCADVGVLLTEWNVFRNLDFKRLSHLHAFFDFRNVYAREKVEQSGITYVGVGT